MERRLVVIDGGAAVDEPTTTSSRRLLAVRRAVSWQAYGLADAVVTKLVAQDALCRVCRAVAVTATREPVLAGKRALLALGGAGPPLSQEDLLVVIDALGGWPHKDTQSALAQLARDPRERVQRAVERAQADQRNPDLRRRRQAEGVGGGHGDDGHAPGVAP